MNESRSTTVREAAPRASELGQLIPETVGAFAGLTEAAQQPGILDRKIKELIALAIAVSARCNACVGHHAQAAARAGATRQELAEALGVAVQMGGGPALIYAADALGAFDEFNTGAARAEGKLS